MNIKRIIFTDMDEMAQSMTKKSLGHAYVIILLCMKAWVENFTYGLIVNLAQALDVAWIDDHPTRASQVEFALETDECPIETLTSNISQPYHVLEGVPLTDEDSQEHKDRMSMFYFM